MQQRSRKKANLLARTFLDNGSPTTDEMILKVLRTWRFHQNKDRLNVIPEGQEWIYSDTLGAVQARHGELLLTKATTAYPHVLPLLTRWLREAGPSDCDFRFTSISLNYDFAARVHRDTGNAGPSLLRVLGNHVGGEVLY